MWRMIALSLLWVVSACGTTTAVSGRSDAKPSPGLQTAPAGPRATVTTIAQSVGVAPAEIRSWPGPVPEACSGDQSQPSWATMSYCGPMPPKGSGNGFDGMCVGNESAPPCGQGMVAGKYYAYTMPGSCDGRIWLDGAWWDSELPPPTPMAPFYVFVTIDADGRGPGFISPHGAVGFRPDSGTPLPGCSG